MNDSESRPASIIMNDKELAIVRSQLSLVESALASIKRDVLPKSEARFRLMAEGYQDQIDELQKQIDDYLQNLASSATAIPPYPRQ